MESKVKKLLVCMDASEQASLMVEYISHFIPPANYSAHLFHVYHKMPHTFWDMEPVSRDQAGSMKSGMWAHRQKESITRLMEGAREKFQIAGLSTGKTEIHIQEREHGVARDITIESQKDYDAVVVGRSAKGELKEWLLGSVTSKVLDHLGHISLCIVGGRPDPGKVLVAMDRSDSSKNALDFIVSLIGGSERELLLFNAVRHLNLPPMIADSPGVKEADHEIMGESRQVMKAILEENKTRLIKAGIPANAIKTKIAFGVNSRSLAIIKEARSGGYGTIVLGRRGLSNIDEFFMGRVSSAVAQLAGKEAVWVVS